MRTRWSLALLLTASGWLMLESPAQASPKEEKKAEKKEPEKKDDERPKDVVVDGELINADLKDKILTQSYCKTYTYKMVKGRRYQIDMKSTAFDAYLRLENPKGESVAADDDSGGMLNSRIVYNAQESGDFTVCAMSLGGGLTGKFTIIVKDITPGIAGALKGGELKLEKGQASLTSQLDENDPMYNGKRHKLFLVNMEAGKTYQIDMKSTAFDPYLFLESPEAKFLTKDDDGGDNRDARITFKATATGKHRIISTYFGNGNGEFTLTVRQTDPAPDDEKKKDAKE